MRRGEPVLVAAVLAAAAWFQPLALYALALGLFGLPHVLWEMQWVRRTYSGSLPKVWWWGVFAVLGVQALARVAGWRGWLSPLDTAVLDVLTLAASLLCVVGAWTRLRHPLRAAVIAMAIVGLLLSFSASAEGLLVALALLAVAHNFTPVLLARPGSSWQGWCLRPLLLALFAWPCAVALLGMAFGRPAGAPLPGRWAPPPEAGALAPSAALAGALMPALVLAQCLHYYCVLRLFPRAHTPGAAHDQPWTMPAWTVALCACVALAGYFAIDFMNARRLYAVAAGAHAWLEWPLILLAVAGGTRPGLRSPPSPHAA